MYETCLTRELHCGHFLLTLVLQFKCSLDKDNATKGTDLRRNLSEKKASDAFELTVIDHLLSGAWHLQRPFSSACSCISQIGAPCVQVVFIQSASVMQGSALSEKHIKHTVTQTVIMHLMLTFSMILLTKSLPTVWQTVHTCRCTKPVWRENYTAAIFY